MSTRDVTSGYEVAPCTDGGFRPGVKTNGSQKAFVREKFAKIRDFGFVLYEPIVSSAGGRVSARVSLL